MEEKDIYYIKLAIKEAKKALLKDEVPIGCVLVGNNKIIARGHNLKETLKKPTAHAEIIAIDKASKKLDAWRLNDLTLYVTLEPCPMCAGAIMQSRIAKVVFGAYDLKGGALGSSFDLFKQKNINHHPIIVGGDLEEECSSLLKNYFKTKRK